MKQQPDIQAPDWGEWSKIGDASFRLKDVLAWRHRGGELFVWLRYRENPIAVHCTEVEAKAFELALKNT